MSDVPVKAIVQRSKETTIHRFRGSFSFDGLTSVLGHVYGSNTKKLVIEYDDDEGDRVRIGSEIEWNECLRLYSGTAPLKLFVRRGKGDERKKADSPTLKPKEESDSEGAEGEAPVVPKLDLPSSDETAATHAEPPAAQNAASTTNAEYMCESQQDNLVLKLVSTLFKCDAAHELMRRSPSVDFGTVVRRVIDPLRQEVHVDIDRETLRHRSIVTANALMDAGELVQARTLLEAAAKLFVGDHIIEYNLACAAALLGDNDTAVALLERAVEFGYDNISHLEKDPDLVSIMGNERVVALIRTMKGESSPVNPEAVEQPVTAVEPTQPSQDPSVRSILSIFPDLSEADVKSLLSEHKGNVHSVVDFLISA